MSGHTPGPWSINGKQSVRGPNGEYILKTNWNNGIANALLAAAAPDLLAALENITGAAKAGMPAAYMRSVIRDAEIAIAKARGDL